MRNFKAIVLPILMILAPASFATRLADIKDVHVCSADELGRDPLALQPIYTEPHWAAVVKDPRFSQLFDFATVDKALKDSRIVREGVSSSHINQILADAFKQVRDEQLKALQSGKLKPVEPGKTYSAEDLEANQASEDQFKQTIVQPKLEAAYAFYLSIMAQRDEVRAEKKKDPQAEAKQAVALNLIEQQRQFLNTALHTYVPTIVDKLGEIPPAVGTNLPFSFRDGVLVKFRLEKQVNGAVQRITLYPRMIMNQLNDEDTFFLEALRSWRDFAKVQYQAAQDAKDSYSVVNWLYGTGDLVAQVPLRQAAYEQSERD
jgi:hypothetical protein